MNTQPPTRRRRRLAIAATLTTTACLLTGAAAFASYGSIDPPSRATGHSEVIAQRVVDLEAGTHHWTTADVHLDADTEGTLDQARFILVREGVVDVDDAGTRQRLPTGEAGYVGDGATVTAGPDGADYTLITLVEGESEQGGFDPGDGARDVDLLRDVLAPGESLTIADAELPIFLLVTDGTVVAATDDELELAADESAQLDGDVTMTNDGHETAIVTVAVTGPLVADEAAASGPASTEATESTESTESESTPSVTAAFTPANPPPGGSIDVTGTGCQAGEEAFIVTYGPGSIGHNTMTTVADGNGDVAATTTLSAALAPGDEFTVGVLCGRTSEADGREAWVTGVAGGSPGTVDSDGDGLSDGFETDNGFDPNNHDMDIDGYELNTTGTDPFSSDSEGDGLNDPDEEGYGTNPWISDTDGDGLTDGDEANLFGTLPLIDDTDGDGFFDGDEVNIGTDPTDPNNHP